MARIRQTELLKRAALVGGILVATLLATAGPASARGYSRDPVFFREPDRRTRQRIEDAIELLKRASASDRTRAREELERIGYWSVEPLTKLIYDGMFTQRRNASLVLGTILDPRGLPHLVKVAREDKQEYPPSFAALMIGKFRDPKTLPFLRSLIRSGRKSHRMRSSVLAVAKVGAPRSFDILLESMKAENMGLLRETATFCLGFFRDQALKRAGGGVAKPVPILLDGLRSRDEKLRRNALLALALLGHRDLKVYYDRFARNPKEKSDIRRIALLALGRFPDEDVTDLLLGILAHRTVDDPVKEMAAMVLKDRKDPRVLEALKKVNPPDKELRAATTLALSNFEDVEAVKILIRRLSDVNDQVRAAAAIGLSGVTAPKSRQMAIDALTQALQRGGLDKDVRYDMVLSRELLRGEETDRKFRWVGNRTFAEDLPKDIEERILDVVNEEVNRILEITSLTPIVADRQEGRFRINDENKDLRDLEEYLEAHPYFEPVDIPEPKVAVTPRVDRPGGK